MHEYDEEGYLIVQWELLREQGRVRSFTTRQLILMGPNLLNPGPMAGLGLGWLSGSLNTLSPI